MIFYLSNEKGAKTLFYKQTRNSVRNVLSSDYVEFKKTPLSKNTSDNFERLMVHCFYDENNLLQEIEIFEPNKVYIKEDNFIGKTQSEIEDYLNHLDLEYELDDMGFIVNDIGMSTVSNKNHRAECIYFNMEKSPSLKILSNN